MQMIAQISQKKPIKNCESHNPAIISKKVIDKWNRDLNRTSLNNWLEANYKKTPKNTENVWLIW